MGGTRGIVPGQMPLGHTAGWDLRHGVIVLAEPSWNSLPKSVWGDREQTRSCCCIDDCVLGICRLMNSGFDEPLNLGQERLASIDQLADIIADIAGVEGGEKHVPGPQVRVRNSDNTLLWRALDWSPQVSLE